MRISETEPASCAEEAARRIEAGGYAARLGLRVARYGGGAAEFSLAYREAHANTAGIVHGGVTASLMLASAALAAWSSQRSPASGTVLAGRPLSLTVSYLQPAPSDGLAARAEVAVRGKSVVHVGTRVTDAGGNALATGAVLYSIAEQEAGAEVEPPAEPLIDLSAVEELETGEGGEITRRSNYVRSTGARVRTYREGLASMDLPLAGNDAEPGVVDEGAVAGCVDTCAALSSRTALGRELRTKAATASLTVNYAAPLCGDLRIVSRLVSRDGESFSNYVEVVRCSDSRVAAFASVIYRFAR